LCTFCTLFLFWYNASGAYWCVFFFFFFCFFCIYVSSLYVLWVASIADLRVFWQPGSVLFVLNCRDYSLFESNKFLLLLLLVHHALYRVYCYCFVYVRLSHFINKLLLLHHWAEPQPKSNLVHLSLKMKLGQLL